MKVYAAGSDVYMGSDEESWAPHNLIANLPDHSKHSVASLPKEKLERYQLKEKELEPATSQIVSAVP